MAIPYMLQHKLNCVRYDWDINKVFDFFINKDYKKMSGISNL